MAIEAGDVVYKFLGDTQNIDDAFKHVNDGVNDIPPIPSDVPESVKLTAQQLREARGEARLLGEEMGIRLPRHVSNFLASLPGVGEALSAAFSATAVLFLAKALADVTSKTTDFVASHFIFTQAMKDSNAAIVATNKLLLEQKENYDKAKESLDKFGASGSDSLRLQLSALKDQLKAQQDQLALAPDQISLEEQKKQQYQQQGGFLHQSWDVVKSWISGSKNQYEINKANVAAAGDHLMVVTSTVKALQEQEALLEKQLATEHQLEAIRQGGETSSAAAKLKAAKKQAEVAEDSETASKREKIAQQLEDELYQIKRNGMQKQLAILKENDENTKDAQGKLLAEMKVAADNQATVGLERLVKAKDEFQKTLSEISKSMTEAGPIEIITPKAVANLMTGIDAAHGLGITLKQDLVKAFNDAKKAQDDFMVSGIQDGVAQTAIANNILKTKAALDSYGQTEDKWKAKSHGLWNEFRTDAKEGATAMDQVRQLGVTAFDDLSKGMESAIQQAILSQGSFTQALEKATANALASIASQALVKALFYTGEGFAALAGFDESGAAEYFQAAGIMASVGAAAGLAAHAMSGGGGSSGKSTFQNGSTNNDTGSQAGSGRNNIGIQHFAEGGLIMQPTLATFAEHGPEVAMPLTDPNAMSIIGKAINGAGGGGSHVHVHFPKGTIVSGVSDLTRAINKAVSRGQAFLNASSSFKVTKRGA